MLHPPAALPLGTLVALGGGNDDPLLALLAGLLPTLTTPVEIITAASWSNSEPAGIAYVKSLRALGCRAARHLVISEQQPADAPATLARLAAAGLMFFAGGDQERLTDLLAGTEFARRLRRRFYEEENFIVAGTSAGAAALPTQMVIDGHGWRALRQGGIQTGPGLNLLPNLLIDQHFAERGRFGRLAHALLVYPSCLGLGLAEETGVIIRQGRYATIFGDGLVMVLDGQQLAGSNLNGLERGQSISGQNLRVHLLVAGQQLDLRSREVGLSA